MTNLMVSAITFSNIATDSFTISWTGPTNYHTHVSRYGVSWTLGTSGGIDTGKIVSTDITDLPTPGAVYTVTVVTYNNVTQVSIPRTVPASKDQASNKFLKLNKIYSRDVCCSPRLISYFAYLMGMSM